MSCHILSLFCIRSLLHWLQQHLASWKESGPCCEVFQPSSSVSHLSELDRTPENFIRVGHKQDFEYKLDEPKAHKVRHHWVKHQTFWIPTESRGGSLSQIQNSVQIHVYLLKKNKIKTESHSMKNICKKASLQPDQQPWVELPISKKICWWRLPSKPMLCF